MDQLAGFILDNNESLERLLPHLIFFFVKTSFHNVFSVGTATMHSCLANHFLFYRKAKLSTLPSAKASKVSFQIHKLRKQFAINLGKLVEK